MTGPSEKSRDRLEASYSRLMSEEYARRWSAENPGNNYAIGERAAVLDRLLADRLPDRQIRLLDLGCGSMSVLPERINVKVNIGVDLLFGRLASLATTDRDVLTVNADGGKLPFSSATFDVVVMSTMMTSVLDAKNRKSIADEVVRVLDTGGVLIWYDLRYPSPFNRAIAPVSRRALARLFPSLQGDVQSLTVIPPLARRLGRSTLWAYPLLAKVPFARSHLAACLVKGHS